MGMEMGAIAPKRRAMNGMGCANMLFCRTESGCLSFVCVVNHVVYPGLTRDWICDDRMDRK